MAYNPIKRIRAWFFDANVPTESKTYIDNNGSSVTKQVKTRLAKNHVPKEETFMDLIHSVFFKSSGTDLQDIASTVEVQNSTDIEKVVKPNQLPILVDSTSEVFATTPTPTNLAVFEAKNINTVNGKGWFFNLTTGFKTWLLARLIPNGGTTGQVLKKVSNTDLDVSWQNDSTGTGLPPFTPLDANKYLQINPTGTGTEWEILDAVTTAQLNTEITNRTNGDSAIQAELDTTQAGAGLNTSGAYSPSINPIISSATSLKTADDLLAIAIQNFTVPIVAPQSIPTTILFTQNSIKFKIVNNVITFFPQSKVFTASPIVPNFQIASVGNLPLTTASILSKIKKASDSSFVDVQIIVQPTGQMILSVETGYLPQIGDTLFFEMYYFLD